MSRLSPPVSRFAAVSLLAMLILFLIFNLLLPATSYVGDQYDKINLLQRQLKRYQFLKSNESLIDEALEKIETQGTQDDLFLKGNKPAIASANLREFVAETVSSSGAQLISSQEYEAEKISEATPIGLRLQIDAEVEEMVNLLHAFENSRPLIFIDELTVTSSASRSKSARADTRNRPLRARHKSLDLRLDIVGYLPGEQK